MTSIRTVKPRPGRPSADEAEQKRLAVLSSALEEFAHAGFHGASLRDIAEKAQVSSRTLYNYFPDKLTLFEACLEHSGTEIRPVPLDLDAGLFEGLVDYTAAMQRQLFTPQAMRIAALIFRESSGFVELRQIARLQFERHQVAPVAAILEKHGLPLEKSTKLATQFVAMAFGEWQRRLLFGTSPMTEEEISAHAKLVVEIFYAGIVGLIIPQHRSVNDTEITPLSR